MMRSIISLEILTGTQPPEVWSAEMQISKGGRILLEHLKGNCICGTDACAQILFHRIFAGYTDPEQILGLFDELEHHEGASHTKIAHVVDAYTDYTNAKLRLKWLRVQRDHEGNEITATVRRKTGLH